MGSEMMVAVMLGLLGLLSTVLVAKAGLPHLAGARLPLAEIVGDAKGFARQAAFGASKQDASKRRTPTPSSRTSPS